MAFGWTEILEAGRRSRNVRLLELERSTSNTFSMPSIS